MKLSWFKEPKLERGSYYILVKELLIPFVKAKKAVSKDIENTELEEVLYKSVFKYVSENVFHLVNDKHNGEYIISKIHVLRKIEFSEVQAV